jgi:hypothetical protein
MPRTCIDCQTSPAAKKKSRCSKCSYLHEKTVRPYETRLRELRNNAKRRGIPFALTLEQFKQFAEPVKLLLGRGRTAQSLTIDRLKEELGYVAGNLGVLENADNVRKENERRKKLLTYDDYCRRLRYIEPEKTNPNDYPF